MDSPLFDASPFEGANGFAKQNNNLFVESAGCLSMGIGVQRKETTLSDLDEILGFLEIFVHQAKGIHICMYHKHDVYAKLCLTSDPEIAISTKTITNGGQNPVFNDRDKLNVRTLETSLKCEIWMLSRMKNCLEDQLLGFALVPLSDVIVNNGKLEKEFPLSSTDLFDSPAGFVQLSIAYNRCSPDVFEIPTSATNAHTQNIEGITLVKSQLDKIEFRSPSIVNQNHIMISKYFGIPCLTSDSHDCSDTEKQISQEVGAKIAESISSFRFNPVEIPKGDSPTSNMSGFSFVKISDIGNAENNPSDVQFSNTSFQPMVSVNTELEPKVKQQDFVDMYMESMQEITKLFEFPTSFGNSNLDQRFKITPKNSGSKVFYGSRAFF